MSVHFPVPPQRDAAAVDEDGRLLAGVAAGDRDAFRALYARFSPSLFSFTLRMVGNAAEAEEVSQDAWVKIWDAAANYDPHKSRPFTWAVTITRRTCIDHLRRRGPRRTVVSLSADDAPEIPGADSPQDTTAAADESALVRAALARMPRKQRDALDLSLFSELGHAEIAQQLGAPVGTVKSWIRRGLLDLRAMLKSLRS